MNTIQTELVDHIQRFLLETNDELLGLHREGGLTYEQYSQIANLVVDTQQSLQTILQGNDATTADSQTLPIPLWLFTETRISPLAKWTYCHLLQMSREFCRPGSNGLVINIIMVNS